MRSVDSLRYVERSLFLSRRDARGVYVADNSRVLVAPD